MCAEDLPISVGWFLSADPFTTISSSRELLGKIFLSDVYNSIEQSSFMQEELQLYFEQFYVI